MFLMVASDVGIDFKIPLVLKILLRFIVIRCITTDPIAVIKQA